MPRHRARCCDGYSDRRLDVCAHAERGFGNALSALPDQAYLAATRRKVRRRPAACRLDRKSKVRLSPGISPSRPRTRAAPQSGLVIDAERYTCGISSSSIRPACYGESGQIFSRDLVLGPLSREEPSVNPGASLSETDVVEDDILYSRPVRGVHRSERHARKERFWIDRQNGRNGHIGFSRCPCGFRNYGTADVVDRNFEGRIRGFLDDNFDSVVAKFSVRKSGITKSGRSLPPLPR